MTKKTKAALEKENERLEGELARLFAIVDKLVLRAGPVELDRLRREVRVDGQLISVAPMPLTLLEELMRHQGETVSYRHLETRLWGEDSKAGINTLTVMVFSLRRVLGPAGSMIQVVRGQGYTIPREVPNAT